MFINMTGISNFNEINQGLILFKSTCGIKQIHDFKVNSITFKVKLGITQEKFREILEVKLDIFNVKTFPKFTGVCFKHKKMRVAGNFFQKSGIMIVMGCKSLDDISNFMNAIVTIGFTHV